MDSEKQSAAAGAKKKNKKKKKIWKKLVTVLVVLLLIGGVIYACMPKGTAGRGTSVYKNDPALTSEAFVPAFTPARQLS